MGEIIDLSEERQRRHRRVNTSSHPAARSTARHQERMARAAAGRNDPTAEQGPEAPMLTVVDLDGDNRNPRTMELIGRKARGIIKAAQDEAAPPEDKGDAKD